MNLELALRADRPPRRARRPGPRRRHSPPSARCARRASRGCSRSTVEPPLARYLVEKGSVAVDGVSLTVSALDERRLLGVADPRDAAADESRRDRRGRDRQHRGGHPRQARRATDAVLSGGSRMSPSQTATPFATIEQAIEDIRQGKMVVVCDDEDRENEGDLTMAAQFATPEAINFMAKEGRGLICLSLTAERCDELGLDLMAAKNESPFETPFTVSVEAREGVTTGISAHDRAHTIQVAIDPESRPQGPRAARPRVPAEEPRRRRARAGGPDRGGGRPRAPGRPEPRGRDLRGDERRRHDGARPRTRRLLRPPRAEHDHRRRPDRLPPPPRQARRAGRRHAAADGLRRLRGGRIPLADRRQAPRGARQGRRRRRARRARAGALGVPHRRRVPLAALRLRRAAGIGPVR